MTRPRLHSLASLAAVLVLALSAAACSDDDPDASGAEESPTASSTPDAPETTSPTEEASVPETSATPEETESTEPEVPDETETGAADPSEPPLNVEDGLARIEAATGAIRRVDRFASPTGNLYCVLDDQFLPPACELGEGMIDAPDYCGADAPTSAIGRIEFAPGSGPTAVCNSDTIREPGGAVLQYGEVARSRGTSVECVLEEIGVTCVDPQARLGFFLARGRFAILS